MNVSQVVRYQQPVKGQRVEELKLVEVVGEEEWKVKKILNKQKNKRDDKILSVIKRIYI